MQIIKITDLEIMAKHGVLAAEKITEQKFLVSCVLECNRKDISDSINSSVDYSVVVDEIVTILKGVSVNLIETLADRIALAILKRFSLAEKITVEVKKPEAILAATHKYVSAVVTRYRTVCYLGLGSNLGDKKANIASALNGLSISGTNKVLAVSKMHDTKPYGKIEQPDFINAAAKIETILSSTELLALCKQLEKQAGRKEREKWAARELDIDILFFGQDIIYKYDLVVPHPDLSNRLFVLKPLCEIAPFLSHPQLSKNIESLLSALTCKKDR